MTIVESTFERSTVVGAGSAVAMEGCSGANRIAPLSGYQDGYPTWGGACTHPARWCWCVEACLLHKNSAASGVLVRGIAAAGTSLTVRSTTFDECSSKHRAGAKGGQRARPSLLLATQAATRL